MSTPRPSAILASSAPSTATGCGAAWRNGSRGNKGTDGCQRLSCAVSASGHGRKFCSDPQSGSPGLGDVRGLNRPAKPIDDPLDDREAEANALTFRRITTEERLENPANLVGRNARPGVFDSKDACCAVPVNRNIDLAALWCEPERVVDEIADHRCEHDRLAA